MSYICTGCLARVVFAAKRETAAAVSIQKYVRKWLLRCAYMKLCSAAIVIQSNVCGFIIRQRFLQGKKHKAATLIQVNLNGDVDLSCGKIFHS